METESFKNILLTTDLSQDSMGAYAYAASLTRLYHAQLTVLTCLDTSMQYSTMGANSLEVPSMYSGAAIADLRARMERTLHEHVTEFFSGLPVKEEIREAPYEPQHSILGLLEESQFNLLVMASHGRSGIKRALIGSVTEYVVRHCHIPVLVIPVRPKS